MWLWKNKTYKRNVVFLSFKKNFVALQHSFGISFLPLFFHSYIRVMQTLKRIVGLQRAPVAHGDQRNIRQFGCLLMQRNPAQLARDMTTDTLQIQLLTNNIMISQQTQPGRHIPFLKCRLLVIIYVLINCTAEHIVI